MELFPWELHFSKLNPDYKEMGQKCLSHGSMIVKSNNAVTYF